MARYNRNFQVLDPDDQAASRRIFALARAPYAGVSGPQKLVNRYLKRFFTPRGSNPLDVNEGTQFPYMVHGNVIDLGAAQSVIALAVEDCNDQMRAVDAASPWLSADERLGDASVLSIDVLAPDGLDVWLQITTRSGRRVPVLLPYARL